VVRRSLPLAAILALAMTWGVTPASATTLERFHVTQPYDYVEWSCGYPANVVGVVTDTVVIRADKRLADNVFVTDAYKFSETWTATDGRSVTLTGNALSKDLKAKPLGGTVYLFTFANPGQLFTISDSSGNVVARDRGFLSYTYTVDIATGEFTFLGTRIAGPHPSWPDFCRTLAPLIGTDSARYLTPRPLGSTSSSMGYYEYLPPSYSASEAKSPLLVAFNGYGENGDGTAGALPYLLNTGIPRFIDVGGWPTDRPLVVLAPQHVETPGLPCTTPDEIHDFIAYAVDRYNVDPARVYATGLSCGAIGTWQYLAEYGNEQVAAAIPIAGDGRGAWEAAGCGLASVPLWAFHGELDDVVSPQGSIVPMTNVQACPGVSPDRAKLTIYPGLYHDGWDQAYSGSLGDDIYTWMLGFSRP
jgi:hypothetical protein